ncbi:MAG: hypothetical protein DMF56_19795 [Acidobacteria bacterium]|nr:MAG: hypothetical protein DMF56_19795 [Acidobacteriota bacterium]
MKKGLLLTLLTIAIAVPLRADRERHQSYISYDEGGTVIRSGEDGKEIDAQRNVPVYPGDEIITARRGRTEIHLSDGNIVGVDRATSVRFRSILDSYDGADNETITELKYGKVAVQRTDIGRDHIRLDTDNASYVASNEAIYSVETDTRGQDRVVVFAGSVEVRTQQRSSRLRAGESASVDARGPYDLVGDQRYAADDFERWFLKRAERLGSYSSRYMDRRLSYYNDDLDDYGRWVSVAGIGWSWRPYVSVGWRPYYNGYWYSRHGCLTWVSYDPWGWGTFHYGRWAYDPLYGWVWVPGSGYSPAWVYWWHGPSYVGWAPAGWWDCHRGYYDWAYRPYRNASIGFGFYGRVRVRDMDLRPWTFIDNNTIHSNRIDRAALTTDAIKQRLGRGGNDGYATISGSPARFVNEKLQDPAENVRRHSLGGDAGIEAGTPADLTGFFRRDPQVAGNIRDRIVRGRGEGSTSGSSTPSRAIGGGGVAPIGGGSVAPVGGGSVAPIGGGSVAPITGGDSNRERGGRVNRGDTGSAGTWRSGSGSGSSGSSGSDRGPTVRTIGGGEGRDRNPSGDVNSGDSSNSGSDRSPSVWRNRRGSEPSEPSTGAERPSTVAPSEPSTQTPEPSRDNSWRRRAREPEGSTTAEPPPASSNDSSSHGSDVPRRVIDRIGGARIYPRDGADSGSSTGDSTPRSTEPSRDSGSTTRSSEPRDSGRSRDAGSRDSGSRDSGSRDSGSRDSGSRDSGSHDSGDHGHSADSGRSSSPPPPPPPQRSNDSGDHGNRESGGHVKRDH